MQNGNILVGKTGEVLHRIAENSTFIAQNVAEIASASKEQSLAIDQINLGLNQIDSVTQQNTANTESSATVAEELSAQARELRALLGQFKLNAQTIQQANGAAAMYSTGGYSTSQTKQTTSKKNNYGYSNGKSLVLSSQATTPEQHVAALDSNEFDRY